MMYILEPIARPKKKRQPSIYREGKMECHRTIGGKGIVGRLIAKDKKRRRGQKRRNG